MKKLLFICEGNEQRSPTFEKWFRENRPQYIVKSTGTRALNFTKRLLEWADKIFLMDLEQEMYIANTYPQYLHKCEVVGCSDQYPRESPRLKMLIWYWCKKRGL